ncbi:MAG: MFS transporter [Coriobacteriales bacterium]|jgi:MFS family permease|nr:MFS transporter [Coriobacteriales bacterium]
MSDTAVKGESAASQKTPSYAWVALIISTLAAVCLVYSWMWYTQAAGGGVWAAYVGYNGLDASLSPNIMGLVPIGCLVGAVATFFFSRYVGPKWTTVIGLTVSVIAGVIAALTVSNAGTYGIFIFSRFLTGFGLATTVIAGPTCVSLWFSDKNRGRAMAIWSCWAPLGIFTNGFLTGPGQLLGLFSTGAVFDITRGQAPEPRNVPVYDFGAFLWIWAIVILVVLVLFVVLFRNPREDERSQITPELKPYSEVMKYFKSRQLWALIFMFLLFNFANYTFTNYLKYFMVASPEMGGLGFDFDDPVVGPLSALILACGILAPIGGFVLDKLPKHLKWVCLTIGIGSLAICAALSFVPGVVFGVFVLFFCIGNMFLNGCCRPMVPTFVFKGGATAVGLGLTFLTFCQYLGQIPVTYLFGSAPTTGFSTVTTDGLLAGTAYHDLALWVLVPALVLGFLVSFLIRPSKQKDGK